MQFKSLLVVAAIAAGVSAEGAQNLKPAGNGALDLTHKGLVAVYKRDTEKVHGDQGATGAVGFRSAMDLTQISKPNPGQQKRHHAHGDEPYIPEWAPGDSVVEEGPMETPAPSQPAAPAPPAAPAVPSSPAAAVVPSSPASPEGHEQATGGAAAPNPHAATSVPPVASAPAPTAQPHVSTPAPAGVSVPAVSVPTPSVPGVGAHSSAPATTAAPAGGNSPAVQGGKGALTFNIENKMGGSITISYQLGTYSPASGGPTTVASQLLGVSQTTGTFASSTQVVAPVGWAGRMTIGKAGAPLDFRGTKIEGNNGFDGADPNADPDPDVDVSYVDGYSVPATCSCGDTVVTGCNKELFDLGNTCSNLAGDSEHKVCVNDPRNIHGPATPFFAPCAKAAYTFDYDDTANWQGTCAGNVINCCIGTSCKAPTRQPAANSKRELMALMGARKRAEGAMAI